MAMKLRLIYTSCVQTGIDTFTQVFKTQDVIVKGERPICGGSKMDLHGVELVEEGIDKEFE